MGTIQIGDVGHIYRGIIVGIRDYRLIILCTWLQLMHAEFRFNRPLDPVRILALYISQRSLVYIIDADEEDIRSHGFVREIMWLEMNKTLRLWKRYDWICRDSPERPICHLLQEETKNQTTIASGWARICRQKSEMRQWQRDQRQRTQLENRIEADAVLRNSTMRSIKSWQRLHNRKIGRLFHLVRNVMEELVEVDLSVWIEMRSRPADMMDDHLDVINKCLDELESRPYEREEQTSSESA